jgi:hypothetical protein
MTLLLNYCWKHNRTLVTADPDRWNYAGRWCTRGWGCYFEPVSNCTVSDVWQPYTLDVRDDMQVGYSILDTIDPQSSTLNPPIQTLNP